MSDEELQKLMGDYLGTLGISDDELSQRMLLSLCREVEREARHAAVRSIFAVANAVSNRVDVKKALDALEYQP